jgi:hypothetical protein
VQVTGVGVDQRFCCHGYLAGITATTNNAHKYLLKVLILIGMVGSNDAHVHHFEIGAAGGLQLCAFAQGAQVQPCEYGNTLAALHAPGRARLLVNVNLRAVQNSAGRQ